MIEVEFVGGPLDGERRVVEFWECIIVRVPALDVKAIADVNFLHGSYVAKRTAGGTIADETGPIRRIFWRGWE